MPKATPDLQLEDVIVLKKQHPCGSNQWCVTRLGADIGLRCAGCERSFLMSRADLAKRIKSLVRNNERVAF